MSWRPADITVGKYYSLKKLAVIVLSIIIVENVMIERYW